MLTFTNIQIVPKIFYKHKTKMLFLITDTKYAGKTEQLWLFSVLNNNMSDILNSGRLLRCQLRGRSGRCLAVGPAVPGSCSALEGCQGSSSQCTSQHRQVISKATHHQLKDTKNKHHKSLSFLFFIRTRTLSLLLQLNI